MGVRILGIPIVESAKEKQARLNAKAKAKQAKQDAKTARVQAKADAKTAKQQAKTERAQARNDPAAIAARGANFQAGLQGVAEGLVGLGSQFLPGMGGDGLGAGPQQMPADVDMGDDDDDGDDPVKKWGIPAALGVIGLIGLKLAFF